MPLCSIRALIPNTGDLNLVGGFDCAEAERMPMNPVMEPMWRELLPRSITYLGGRVYLDARLVGPGPEW